VSAIGELPLPLVHRSVVINMRRDEAKSARREYDELDPVFPIARELIRKWAQICVLARDPEMPDQLRNRSADNWLCSDRPDEDVGVVLLGEIQTIFLVRGLDRVTSADLVEALLGLDDGFWNEWRGPKDDRPARKLNQTGLAEILRPFGIRSRTIWAAGRRPGDSSKRGFYRSQFEDAWRRYCPPADTPTQLSKISA